MIRWIAKIGQVNVAGVVVLTVLTIAVLIGLSSAIATSTGGQTIVVDDDGQQCDTAITSITAGVKAATSGDTVRICPGTYTERVSVETSNLFIRGEGNATIVSGLGSGLKVNASHVTIQGLIVRATDGVGILVTADETTIRGNRFESASENGEAQVNDDGIRLVSTNQTVVQNNTIIGFEDDGISIGELKTPKSTQPISTRNHILNNTISGTPGFAHTGINVGRRATRTKVYQNRVLEVRADVDTFLGSRQSGIGIGAYGNQTVISGNTITSGDYGIHIASIHAPKISQNKITNNDGDGLIIWENIGRLKIRENKFTNNSRGIFLYNNTDRSEITIHQNVIRGNRRLGIHNRNIDKLDGNWPYINATYNKWGCGGPSGGLKDPVTHRMANGSGDRISAGDEPGMSNVRFDPFLERSSCQTELVPTPSPTETRTARPSSTASSTPSVTPTPTQVVTSTTQTVPSATNTPSDGNTGESGGIFRGTESKDTITATPNPDPVPDKQESTPTALSTATEPPTAPPSPSVTRVVETGFGIVSWISGIGIAILLVIRRFSPGSGER